MTAVVLAALVAMACRLVPRIRAGHRAILWWLVSAKLLVGLLPLPALEIEALPAPATDAVLATSSILSSVSRVSSDGWVGWAWIVGATLLVASAAPGWRRARSWRASGRSIDDSSVRLSIARASRAVGLDREPSVLAVPGLTTPLVTGLLRPCVLLPEDVLRLPAAELEMALAHEMAHVARGDLWWGLVPSLARRIFFFHPAAWLAEREYAIAREAACDEAVLRPGADAAAYGRLLVRFATRPPASATIPVSAHSMLRRRLEMIEIVVRRVPVRRAGWMLVAVAALALVPVRLAVPVNAGDRAQACREGETNTAQGCVKYPRVIHKTQPLYPPAARTKGVEGTVTLQALIDTSGHAGDIQVVDAQATDAVFLSEFEGAAKTALGSWRYEPGTLEGHPVSVQIKITMNFSLSKKPSEV